MTQVIIKMNC